MSSTKGETRPNKGRDYEIAKWEEEIRKSLATKKATTVTLTKQQQVLVQTQLENEAKIRKHVQDIHANLTRGLHLVRSIVTAGVDEFHSYMSSVVSLLLDGALSRGSFLVGATAFETYLVSYLLNAIVLFIYFLLHAIEIVRNHVRPVDHIPTMDRYCNAALLQDWVCPWRIEGRASS